MREPAASTERGLISRAELEAWLDGQAQVQTLIAPHQVSGVVLYRPVENSREVYFGSTRPAMSAKDVFFPATEHLLAIRKHGMDVQLRETFPEGKATIFGVRPCDARGIRLLDSLFIGTAPPDPYYASRRESTTLVGLACKELGPTCFCTSMGGAPDDPTGMDVILYPHPAGYLVEALNARGQALLDEAGWQGTTQGGVSPDMEDHFKVLEKAKWPGHFNDEYWPRMAERCLSCRACAYVCPTCRCFAVRDERLGPGEFERVRCWDSCTGENYRRVAGGHRARPEKGERLRNRFFCKFLYFPEQIGMNAATACTGCGRCVEVCPSGVDILEVLQDLGRMA